MSPGSTFGAGTGPLGPALRALTTLQGELGFALGTQLEKEASIDGGGTCDTR